MTHLESIIQTQKIIWVKRFSDKAFLKYSLKKIGGCNILNRKIPQDVIKQLKMSDFNNEMITIWNKAQDIPSRREEIGNQYLWHNENITTPNGKTLNYPRMSKLGINFVKGILEDGKIMPINGIDSRNNLTNIKKIEMQSVLNYLPRHWKQKTF